MRLCLFLPFYLAKSKNPYFGFFQNFQKCVDFFPNSKVHRDELLRSKV
jgi:hypothetical protein